MSRNPTPLGKRVEYDSIAANYDRRYEGRAYHEVDRGLRDWIRAAPGPRLLEIGCGTGHWLRALGEGRTAFGLDRSAGMLAQASAGAPAAFLVQGEATNLPFRDESVDAVLCVNAFQHFPDKPAFLAEAVRVLVPGGLFCTIGLDPHREQTRWVLYEYFDGTLEADLARYPPCQQIVEWLEHAGFASCSAAVIQSSHARHPVEDILASHMLEKGGTSELALLSDQPYAP